MTKAEKSIPAASLKSLAGTAPQFTLPVSFKRLDGEEVTIQFQALALRKTEWAAKRDAFLAQSRPKTDDEPAQEFSWSGAVAEDLDKASALALEFVNGWDLADDFNAANLALMEDHFGGSLSALLHAYDAAVFRGRVGN